LYEGTAPFLKFVILYLCGARLRKGGHAMNMPVSELLRRMGEPKSGRYIREKGKGIPGQPGYKPTLWYWRTPSGKKKLVDQKSG
jgi:hypothetical protein